MEISDQLHVPGKGSPSTHSKAGCVDPSVIPDVLKTRYISCHCRQYKQILGPPANSLVLHEGPKGKQRCSSALSLTSALDGGGLSTPRPGRFTHGKDPVPIVQEAGWAPGPVWTGAEILAPTGNPSPDLPTRSQSLYQPRYPGTAIYRV